MKLYFIIALTLLSLTCKREAEVVGPAGPSMYLETKNLLPLNPGEGHYEAWVSFANPQATVTPAATTTDTSFVSFGKFNVDEFGRLIELDGKLFTPRLAKTRNPQYAIDAVISIEPNGVADTLPGSVIIGGEFTGDLRVGVANLSTNYRDAFGTDFQNARGYFLLDAPTATDQSDSINGVWFMKSILPPTAGLMNLPPLSEGWKYEGWIIAQCATTPEHPLTHFFQTGTFQTSAGFDGDSAGPTRGMNGNGYPFPGQDFIQDIRLDFKSHCLSVMVTIEPDDVAVPFTPMILFKSTLIPTSLRRGQSVQMQNNAANFPTAKITLVR